MKRTEMINSINKICNVITMKQVSILIFSIIYVNSDSRIIIIIKNYWNNIENW